MGFGCTLRGSDHPLVVLRGAWGRAPGTGGPLGPPRGPVGNLNPTAVRGWNTGARGHHIRSGDCGNEGSLVPLCGRHQSLQHGVFPDLLPPELPSSPHPGACALLLAPSDPNKTGY